MTKTTCGMCGSVRPAITLLLVAGFLSGSVATAAELFVDQKHPEANDKNAGTEAKPFKTIPAAVAVAKPGDTIWVKEGRYEEEVKIVASGTFNQPITLSAWRDDRVQIGYAPRPLPIEGEWKALAGTKSYQVKLAQDVPEDFVVLLNDKAHPTFRQDGPPKDEKPNWAAYRKADRTLMFNTNGVNPATLGKFEYGRSANFFRIDEADHWTVRKLEVSYSLRGLFLTGANCIVEDCFFTRCYLGGLQLGCPHARTNVIRRCNFYRCGSAIGACGAGVGHIIEDNVIVECDCLREDNLFNAIFPGSEPEGDSGPTCFKGNMLNQLFIHNIVSDNRGTGWYADCEGIQGSRLIGNAFWDNGGGGIYNEAWVHDTMTQANVFYRNGISSAGATRWNIVDNLFFEGGIHWYALDCKPLRGGYMLLRRNAFIKPPPQGYLCDTGLGDGQSAWPEVFRDSIVDRNRIWQPAGGVLINDGGVKKYKTLEEVQKEFDWERHGEVKPYDKDKDTVESVVKAMGGSVVTFRIPWGKHSAEARPMLSNSEISNRWPTAVLSTEPNSVPSYFWRVADGNYDPTPLWGSSPMANWVYHEYWTLGGGTPDPAVGSVIHGCRWYCDAEADFPADLAAKTASRKGYLQLWNPKMTYTQGSFWLVVEGLSPEKMLPQGVGHWTPLLGAAPGAKITVSLKMRGKDLAAGEKGSPAVWLQFTNETGQKRRRVFLVGKDDAGQWQRADLTKGNFPWTEVKQEITAPKGAVRMALFLGLLPCKGQVNYGSINITTASEGTATEAEILPPRLPLQKIKETCLVNISKVANRSLTDDRERENDGLGGWSDQGSDADMRELKTGDRRLGGVMFRILPGPKSIIVLKSANRAAGDKPEKVTIPVGRNLDTIFFLHAAAWCPKGNEEAFHYVIHYADGKDVTLQVTGQNLADWIADPVARFPLETGTVSTVAETVKNPRFRQGSIYRMEWSAPTDRRAVEVKSIEFVGNGSTVPVLLGITGVTEW